MKEYMIAIEEMNNIYDKADIKGELKMYLHSKTSDARMHILKAALIFVYDMCKDEDFGPAVKEIMDNVNYDNLDLFEKAVIHILSFSKYKNGYFELSTSFPLLENENEWGKTISFAKCGEEG
jgi:hypothetical protein